MTLIVRSCGERTTKQCLKLLGAPAHVVDGTPFSETLRRSFALGIAEARPYTVMIDADLLPFPHLLDTLLEAAEADDGLSESGPWFEKHALVFCKFFGRRGAGNRIYRTALLPQALDLVDTYRDDKRPETAIIREMAERGYSRGEIDRVVALHGWEQFNRDIYRIAYVHAVKSRARIPTYIPKWKRAARRDADYTLALEGAEEGLLHEGGITIDAGMFTDWLEEEKGPLGKWAPRTLKAWKKWRGTEWE